MAKLPIWLITMVMGMFVVSGVRAETTDLNEITIAMGEAKVIQAPGVTRIAIGSKKILTANAIGTEQVLIMAEGIGVTTIHIWSTQGPEIAFRVRVLPVDPASLKREISEMLSGFPNVTVRSIGDKIVLEGHNVSDEGQERLKQIQSRFPQVINFVGKVGWEKMVHMDVKIVEFRKGALEELGVRWNLDQVPGPSAGLIAEPLMHGGRFIGPDAAKIIEKGSGADSLPAQKVWPPRAYFGIITGVSSLLKLAASNGDALTLAEPKLSCRSGGFAKFLAGGEVPIPVANKFGGQNVTYKEFGVILEIKPAADDTGAVSAMVKAQVSAIDPSVKVGDFPGFVKRATETEINLRDGETLVISGFFNNEIGNDIQKVAGLGDIPILGALFRSTQFRNNKSELVMFITPRVMSAASPSNRQEVERTQERIERYKEKVKDKIVE